MSLKKTVQELQKAFPDLNSSVFPDVLKQCKGDKKAAAELLSKFGSEEEERNKQQARKIAELKANFQDVSENVIASTLAQYNWDVEKAILPLFERIQVAHENKRKEELQRTRAEREANLAAKQKDARARANHFLEQLFKNVASKKIQELLDENEGDVDATTDQLLELVKKQEAEQIKTASSTDADQQELCRQQELLERSLKIDTLKQKFGDYITEEEVCKVLDQNSWDIRKVSAQLLRTTEDRKKQHLARFFPDVDAVTIEAALTATRWDLTHAMKVLGKSKIQQPEQGSSEPSKDDFLERSTILGQELSQLVAAQQQELGQANADTIFKEELEKKIRFGPEDVPGLPGMVPITKKMLDKMKNNPQESPVPVGATVSESVVGSASDQGPVKGGGKKNHDDDDEVAVQGAKLELSVSPARLDLGGTISVSWKTDGEPSTSDWIGLYRVGADNRSYKTYKWIGKARSEGKIDFACPSRFGQYQFRYFSNRSYSRMASSSVVTVGPAFDLSASYLPDTQKIKISFTQTKGNQYPSAWIGMYPVDVGANHEYVSYQWVSSAVDKSLLFDAPKTGTWEFRFFPQKTYVDVARCKVDVHGQDCLILEEMEDPHRIQVRVTAVTADPFTDYAWIGIYHKAETDNRQYRRYAYICKWLKPGQHNCCITFKKPITPGTYEARLFANRQYGIICRSLETIVIPEPAE